VLAGVLGEPAGEYRSYLPNAAMNALTRFGPDLEVYAEELGDAAATVPETCANPD
jgi:hypothetical protein